jgi:hypothetical protein
VMAPVMEPSVEVAERRSSARRSPLRVVLTNGHACGTSVAWGWGVWGGLK